MIINNYTNKLNEINENLNYRFNYLNNQLNSLKYLYLKITCNSYNESNNIIPLKFNTKENYKIQKNNDFYDNFFNNNFLKIENNSDSFSF